mgnify:FL=1
MKKKLVLLLLLITAVVVGRAQTKQDLLTVGTLAPDFTIANGNSKKALSLSDLRAKKATNGKVRHGVWTVLDFWASWCPDCRRDMPIVKQINEKFGKKIKLIGVSFDTDKEKMAKYLETNKYSWTQYSEFKKWKETKISKDYHISWIPTSYLIDPEGKVAFATIKTEEMLQKLEALDAAGKLK